MASPPPPRCRPDGDAPPAMKSLEDLPDHIVEDILLRLPADDIDRASVAGGSFRRVIATRPFLRRFRALHRPSLLGILACESAESTNLSFAFLPAQPPHPSAAAGARTLAATDFSCSFLPSPELWRSCDSRDGRILLSKEGDFLGNLVVCDPLHRRYLLIPALPDDLTSLARELDSMGCDPFLAPAGEEEGDNADIPSGFRVMCFRMWCSTKLVLFIFSSSGERAGQWHTATFHDWDAFRAGNVAAGYLPPLSMCCYYAHGCLYWGPYMHKFLVFNMGTDVISSLIVPRGRCQIVIVEATEGRLGMFSRKSRRGRRFDIIEDDEQRYLLYDILQDNEDGTKQWRTEDVILLPYNKRYEIMGVSGGSLLLHVNLNNPDSPNFDSYSVDIQTLKLEWFCGTGSLYFSSHTHLYAGFPPSLSPPTI